MEMTMEQGEWRGDHKDLCEGSPYSWVKTSPTTRNCENCDATFERFNPSDRTPENAQSLEGLQDGEFQPSAQNETETAPVSEVETALPDHLISIPKNSWMWNHIEQRMGVCREASNGFPCGWIFGEEAIAYLSSRKAEAAKAQPVSEAPAPSLATPELPPLVEWGLKLPISLMQPLKYGGWYEKFAVDKKISKVEAERDAALQANAQILEAINWACGCIDDFRPRQDGEATYWWRSELAARAGLQYNGTKYEVKK